MPDDDPHVRRLILEQERLITLASRSDFIRIEPIDIVPGMPPEKYVITFTCKGIGRLGGNREPISSNFHQVSMYISREFPRKEPYLKWLTPIWHPNIEHDEPHHVCTNEPQNFFATKGMDEFVLILGEMVQYRRYHAVWQQPWPLDKEAADWVVEYAEPHGIVGPDKPFDDRPLLREYKIRVGGSKAPRPRKITLGPKQSGQLPTAPVKKKPGITFGPKRS
jgi:hypothetical protein